MSKNFFSIFMVVMAAVFVGLFQTQPAQAASFNPGDIISDPIFTNQNSMTADAIQNFIVAKNAHCVNGEAPCLRNFTEHGKSAGTIIKEAANTYRINPQTLIVLLQKETGLITGSRPTNWLYKIATGYGCPDTAACDSQYYGFTNQVHKAARMFRLIMDDHPNWYTPYELGVNYVQYHPNASCGGTNITIQNRATQALYNYTPYQPNAASLAAGFGTGNNCSSYGNRNFWLYFNAWFGSTHSSILLQSPQSPAVYLQSGSTRYGIPEWATIEAYGLSGTPVTPVTDAYMNSLANGGVLSTIFANKSQPGPIFIADNGKRYGFASHQQCIDWGFPRCLDRDYARALEPAIFDRLTDSGAIGTIMKHGGSHHLMQNGEKVTFASQQAIADKGYGAHPVTSIVNAPNARQPHSYSIPQNNSLVQFAKNPAIYAYTNNKFYPLSWSAYTSLAGQSTPFFHDNFSRYTVSPPTAEPMVGSYIRFSDGRAFAFSENQKIDITAVSGDWPDQQTVDPLKTIADRRASDITANPNSTYRTPSGSIFRIHAKTRQGFYSLSDYFAMGYDNPIAVGNHVANDLRAGTPVFAPGHGSLYQTSVKGNEASIYTLSTDGTTCQIYSMPQLSLYNLKTDSVYRITNLTSDTVNLLSTNVYDEKDNLHITYDGVHSVIPKVELQNTWGITSRMRLCGLNSNFLAQNKVNHSSPRFVRNEHTGIIYYGDSGKKRPIYSYNAFLKMGGSSENTQNVSMEFLVSSPDGVPIYD